MTGPPEHAHRVGQRVHALRLERNLSVHGLASSADVSASIISRIERSRANPSLRTLDKLASALGTTLNSLLENAPARSQGVDSFVRRKADRPVIYVGEYPITKELLSPVTVDDPNMMIITFPPGSHSKEVITGPGQKAGLVLEGEVVLGVDGEEAVARKGDSFQFDSSVPHNIGNDSEDAAHVMWIFIRPMHTTGLF